MSKCIPALWAASAIVALSAQAHAGTFKSIAIDGDYTDWSDVPVATTESVNTGTPVDFASLKITNDETNVYFLITYNTAYVPRSNGGVFTAVDSDANPATGYSVFGNPAIGSNFGLQNDFPFTQRADQPGVSGFNSGGTVVGATYTSSPNGFEVPPVASLQQEFSLPLTTSQVDASVGGYTGLVFTPTFVVEFYSDNGAGDTLGPVSYSLAAVPEPASLGLLALGATALVRRRRGA